jgi:beta-glucosidase-like glycosyl hydrolase
MVASGEVTKAKVDDSAVRILWPFFAVGLFDKNNTNVHHNVTSPEHLQLARDISAQATVLLQVHRCHSFVGSHFGSRYDGGASVLLLSQHASTRTSLLSGCCWHQPQLMPDILPSLAARPPSNQPQLMPDILPSLAARPPSNQPQLMSDILQSSSCRMTMGSSLSPSH